MKRNKKLISTGIDISDRSIEMIELEFRSKRPKVKAYSRMVLPQGVVVNGEIVDQLEFDKLFNNFLDQAEKQIFTFENITLSIPEELIVHELIDIEESEGEVDIESKVIEKIRDTLLENSSKWQYEIYEILVNEKPKYIYTGIASQTLHDFVKRIQEYGLKIDYAEPDATSLIRNIENSPQGNIIIDFGHSKTIMYFAFNGTLYKRKILKWGSSKIITKLSEYSKLKVDKEEKFFHRTGFGTRASDEQKKIIKEEFESFNKKLSKFIKEVESDFGVKTEEIYITGGLSRMIGLTKVMNPDFTYRKITSSVKFEVEEDSDFLTTLGSALRGLYPQATSSDINFLNSEIKGQIAKEVEELFEKKEEEILKQEIGKKDNEDPKKKELMDLFAEKWGSTEVTKQKEDNKWSANFKLTGFAEIIILVSLCILGVFALLNYTNHKKLDELKKEAEAQTNQFERDFFTYNFELIVSSGENLSDTQSAAVLGRFDEYLIEIKDEFLVEDGIVSEEDIEEAKDIMEKRIRSGEGSKENLDLSEGEYIVPEAVFYEEGFLVEDVNVGAQVEKFTITLKARVRFAIIDETKFDLIVQERIVKALRSVETQENYELNPVKFLRLEYLEEFNIVKFNITVEAYK